MTIIIIIDVRTVVLNEKKKKVKLEIVGSSHRAIVRDTPALKRASLEKNRNRVSLYISRRQTSFRS